MFQNAHAIFDVPQYLQISDLLLYTGANVAVAIGVTR